MAGALLILQDFCLACTRSPFLLSSIKSLDMYMSRKLKKLLPTSSLQMDCNEQPQVAECRC